MWTALLLAGCLLHAGAATAQPAFNMGGQSGGQGAQPAPSPNAAPPFSIAPTSPQPAAPSAAAPAAQPFGMNQPAPAASPAAPVAPAPAQPAQADQDEMPFQMPGAPAPTKPAARPDASKQRTAGNAMRVPDRFIVPLKRLRLDGEVDARAWVLYASEDEAKRPATLLVGYTNAVVVMPEASRLRVFINGQSILETPISSSQAVSQLVVPIRPNVMRAGANLIRFEVTQRHRTDCGVSSTYELWTDIDNASTGLSYAGGLPALSSGLDDLPAVGVDETGATRIRVVTSGPLEGGTSARVLRAVQGLALRGRYPHPVVSLSDGSTPPANGRGGMVVVIGTAAELPRLMGTPPAEAATQPVARFVADPRFAQPTLVIAGPLQGDVDNAIERVNAIPVTPRDAITTASRFAPDAPLFTGARHVRLADLGISTQEFSGRRFRVRFGIALPSDFYANAYGQARLLLDAAYTASVRPGSHVDVYVNDQIASTLTISAKGGGLFQRHPISIPLTNFRPGLNRMWIEVVLDTESDARCLPGATLPGDDRFVLFDSSEFAMENFARIGRTPDLAAFAARAFPYRMEIAPVAVVLARHDAPTVASGATLMARLAMAKGEPLPVDANPSASTLGNRPAIFVGAIGQIATGILTQVGIAETARVNWLAGPGDDTAARAPGNGATYDDVLQRYRGRQAAPGSGNTAGEADSEGDDTSEVYQRWRENLSGGGGISGVLTSFENWAQRTFGISYSSLRIGEAEQTLFEPPPRTSLLLAQGIAPNGSSTWTLAAGRTPESLAGAMESFTSQEVWNRLSGQAAAYQAATGDLETVPVGRYLFVVTEALGFGNFRLVAANWLSLNILPYALILVFCGTVLGIATTLLLRRLGRTA